MVHDLRFLQARNNKTASYKAIHFVYDDGSEKINLRATQDQLEKTIRFIQDNSKLMSMFSDEQFDVMRSTFHGQILRLSCISYYLQYVCRHFEDDEDIRLKYFHAPSFCHEFMTILNEHKKLRKLIGDDFLLLT